MGIPYRLQVFCFRGKTAVYERLQRIFPEEKSIARGWLVMPQSHDQNRNQGCMVPVEEMADSLRCRQPRSVKVTEPLKHYLHERKTVHACAAGLVSVHIASDFKIKPCIFIQNDTMTFSLDSQSFEEIFFEKMPYAITREMSTTSPCYSCSLSQWCCRCAALGYGTGRVISGNQVLCRIASVISERKPFSHGG